MEESNMIENNGNLYGILVISYMCMHMMISQLLIFKLVTVITYFTF